MSLCYLNGEYLPLESACVSVLDRGFLFGDGVYEVVPAYGRRLFRLQAHLERLENSLRAIRIEPPLAPPAWQEVLEHLLECNPGEDQSVYLQVTRGTYPKRDHAFADTPMPPTLFAMSSPIPEPDPALFRDGIAAITLDDIRWAWCNVKAVTLLPNALLRQQALDAGAAEAILVRDGEALEGAASNLFLVQDGVLLTPPRSNRLLPGITRDLVLELAENAGIPVREQPVPVETLRSAEELWVTSSTREIVPVTRLDDEPVGEGHPGPLFRRLHRLYQDYKQAFRRGEVC